MTGGAETAQLMDAVYRHQRHVYDVTRKYYLLGRDHLIERLDPPAGGLVLELGCGTGRNLIAAARRYPEVHFYGLDISRHMLDTAELNITKAGLNERISLIQGDAANPEATKGFDVSGFDRVFYSYTLSMIPIWKEALAAGAVQLSKNGRLHVVDFGQQDRLPRWFKNMLFSWLRSFHVTPRADLEQELAMLAEQSGIEMNFRRLYRGYTDYAELCKIDSR